MHSFRGVRGVLRRNRAALLHGYLVALAAGAVLVAVAPRVNDSFAYWSAGFPPAYQSAVGDALAFPYSPAAAAVFAPLRILPWPVFEAALLLATGVALAVMTGPWAGLVLLLPFVAMDFAAGNIHVLLALAIVVGFRWPAAWSAILLTKVLPGIGLLWFLIRREWGHLAWALGATVALVAVTIAVAGTGPWIAWLQYLLASPDYGSGHPGTAIPVPLVIRLPVAIAVVTWGALTSRRWSVPVAATLALPVLWFNGLALLVAVIPLAIRTSRSAGRADPGPGASSDGA